jgi:hypothetical protein
VANRAVMRQHRHPSPPEVHASVVTALSASRLEHSSTEPASRSADELPFAMWRGITLELLRAASELIPSRERTMQDFEEIPRPHVSRLQTDRIAGGSVQGRPNHQALLSPKLPQRQASNSASVVTTVAVASRFGFPRSDAGKPFNSRVSMTSPVTRPLAIWS